MPNPYDLGEVGRAMRDREAMSAFSKALARVQPAADRESERQTTHWDGCWREHHECAVAMIERWLPVVEAARELSAGEWEQLAVDLADTWWGNEGERTCRAIAATLGGEDHG